MKVAAADAAIRCHARSPMSALLFLISLLRTLVEVALLSLLAQGIVGLLSGAARQANPVYRVLALVSAPALRASRFVAGGVCPERRLPLLAFLLLFSLWIGLAWLKLSLSAPV